MFRFSLILLLMATLLLQSMSRGIVVLSYLTNTEMYQELCINKAKPALHCNGKCQMNKKIKEQENKDQKDPLKTFKYSEVCMICPVPFGSDTPFFIAVPNNKIAVLRSMGHTSDYISSSFHPPDTV